MITQPLGCRSRKQRRVCNPERDETLDSYDEVVESYIRRFRDDARQEQDFFAGLTLDEAIKIGALSMRPDGKRHLHQRRIPPAALAQARRLLQKTAGELLACETFDELHELVNRRIRRIYKIGALAVYDMATRLGAQLGLAPDFIYLHAGTAKGARAIMSIRGRDKISRAELPRPFRRLRCYEAEDCLCIYKRDLARIGAMAGRLE